MELKAVLKEIEQQKEEMENYRRKVVEFEKKFQECQQMATKKMEKAACLEDEYKKSVTSKLSLSIYINLKNTYYNFFIVGDLDEETKNFYTNFLILHSVVKDNDC